MKVILEVYFIKIADERVLFTKHNLDLTKKNSDPDNIVIELTKDEYHETPRIISNDFIIHSTSWRYEFDNSLVITYLVYSDHIDFSHHRVKEIPIRNLQLAKSADPKRPRPEVITDENVISHGIRHLGFLAKTEKEIIYGKHLKPQTLKLLQSAFYDMAGKF